MFALLSFTFGLALAQGTGAPHSYKLNRPLVRDLDGDVIEVQASPDGTRVVYRASATSYGTELFSAAADGLGPVVQLSDHAPATSSFRFSPDGAWVVYVAEHLYSVASDGSQAPVRISGSGGGQIVSFALSADSLWAVYETLTAGKRKLFSAPLDTTGAAVMLNGPVTQGSGVQQYQITADSSTVLYRASAADADADLYRVPIDRSAAPLQLNPPLASGSVAEFELVPGDAQVVYRARQDSPVLTGLYVVSTTGGGVLELDAPPAEVSEAHVSADGTRVVYLATDLFSVPITGGAPTFLTGAPAADFQISPDSTRVAYHFLQGSLFSRPIGGGSPQLVGAGAVQTFAFSPDGARVLYRVGAAPVELFSAPVGGGTAVKLSPPTTAFGVSSFAIDASSGRVAFLRAWVSPSLYELWSAPIDGAQPAVRLSPVAEHTFSALNFTVGNGRGFYVADFERDDVFQLYRAPLDGAQPPLRLNAPFQPGSTVLGDVLEFLVAPRGGRVAYYADQQIDENFESYAVRDDGGPVQKLGASFSGLYMRPVALAPDGTFAVLHGWGSAFGLDLFRASLDGSQPLLPLTGPSTQAESVGNTVLLEATGAHVVYVSEQRLWTVPTDASAPPSVLSPLVAGNGFEDSPENVRLGADGARVVFVLDRQATFGLDLYELYSAPSDGSQPAVRLHPALANNAQVFHFALTPDSTHVVFSARLTDPGPLALYSVPIDGSAAPTRISLPLANREVLVGAPTAAEEFQIAPDGRSVVYLAGSGSPGGKYELHAVPSDGSAGGVRLNGNLPPGGDALAFEPYYDPNSGFHIAGRFRIAPDSRHVVYVADQRVDGQFELFSTPLPEFHGHAGPTERARSVRLSLPQPGEFLTHFAISPDGNTVVYLAGSVFRVPIEGGTPVRLSSGPSIVFVADEFVFTPDSSSVLFRADLVDRFELFDVPLDLAYPPRRINGPLQPAGDVRSGFRLSPDGRRVFYLADQDQDEVFELYGASALHARRAELR